MLLSGLSSRAVERQTAIEQSSVVVYCSIALLLCQRHRVPLAPPPPLPDEIQQGTRDKYLQARELITGKKLEL